MHVKLRFLLIATVGWLGVFLVTSIEWSVCADEIDQLANVLTNPYRREARATAFETTVRPMDLERVATSLASQGSSEAIRKSAQKGVSLKEKLDEIERQGNKYVEEATAAISAVTDGVGRAAESGAFKGEETTELDLGNGVRHQMTQEVDYGLSAVIGAHLFGYAMKMDLRNQALKLALPQLAEADRIRISAWDDLLPEFADGQSGPISEKELIEVKIADAESGQEGLTLRAQNVSGRKLSNVIIAVDFFHALVPSTCASRQIYYLPEMDVDAAIYSGADLVTNVDTATTLLTDLAAAAEEAAPLRLNRNGFIGIQVQVWADEARHSSLRRDDPQRVRAAASMFFGDVFSLLSQAESARTTAAEALALSRKPRSKMTLQENFRFGGKDNAKPTADKLRAQARELDERAKEIAPEAAKYVQAFAAKDSDELKISEQLATSPTAALQSWQRIRKADLIAALKSAKVFTTGAPPDKRLEYQFTAGTAGVKANVVAPEKPTVKRTFEGEYWWNAHECRYTVRFSLPPAKGRSEPDFGGIGKIGQPRPAMSRVEHLSGFTVREQNGALGSITAVPFVGSGFVPFVAKLESDEAK